MIVRNVDSPAVFNFAAESIGITVEVTQMHPRTFRVKVSPGEFKDTDGDRKYQRISLNFNGNERRVYAVCWHGFRDFFRACFKQQPDLIFKTRVATWDGTDDFEERYRGSGWDEMGSTMNPIAACEECRCPDMGEAN